MPSPRGFRPISSAQGQAAAWAAGDRIVLTVHGQKATIANIYKTYDDIVDRMRKTTRETAQNVHDMAYQLSPVDTGRMRESLTVSFSDMGLAFDVFFDPLPFIVDGVAYYPPFQEFGTKYMDAQPSLIPAYRFHERRYKADIGASVREAIARNRRAA